MICTTLMADVYGIPDLHLVLPSTPKPTSPSQQISEPDLNLLVLHIMEKAAMLFITLKSAAWNPSVVCNGDVNGNNSLFHQALGMSVNEKICALEVTAQNSLFRIGMPRS